MERKWGVMYPNLSTRKFHIRSRTSICLNIPPVHTMVAKHGLITEGGSWAECGLSNLAYQWVLLRCAVQLLVWTVKQEHCLYI